MNTTNFQLDKYYDKEGSTVPQVEVDGSQELKKESKTISVGVIGKDKVSGYVAQALVKALARDDLHLTEVEGKPKNDIFKKITIVSSESINSIDFDITVLDDTDIVLTDNVMPTTAGEQMFYQELKDRNIKRYTDPKIMAMDLDNSIQLSEDVEYEDGEVEVNHITDELRNSRNGNLINYNGEEVVVLYNDGKVALLKCAPGKYHTVILTDEVSVEVDTDNMERGVEDI